MFCTKCGNKIDEGERFCGECGNPVAQPQMQPQSQVNAPAEDATVMAASGTPEAIDATVMAAASAPAPADATVMASSVSEADATVMAASAPVADATVMATASVAVQPQYQEQPQAAVQPVPVQYQAQSQVPAQPQYQVPAQPQATAQPQYQAPVQPQTATQPQATAQPQMQGQSLMQPDAQAQAGAQGSTLVAKKKKPWVVFIVIGAIVLVLGGVIAGLFAFGAVDKINSRLKTSAAEKYFSNMDYDNAIAYYLEAIEIDPTNVDAYLGLAEVYVAQDDLAAAIDILEQGAQATNSEKIEERLEEVYELDRYIFGYVYKVDIDTDPTNNEPLAGAEIEITFPNGDVTTYIADDNGYYETENELPAGKYEVHYYYSDEYIDYTETIKAEEGKIEKNVYLEPLIYANLYGNVLEGDEDTDYTNNYGLEGADVKIEKINASNSFEQSTVTDYNGRYEFNGLLMGVYKLTIHKDGYIDVVQNVIVYEGQTEVYNSVIELISTEYQGEGNAEGVIYDAVTGYGVEGLTLYIRSGINNIEGATTATTTTDSNGGYRTPDLPSGNYCIQVVDERDTEEPYISTQINVKILGGITIYNQDATVSSVLMDGQLRIVLTWGSRPYDLDSHLLINIDGTHNGHVYFGDDYDVYDGEEIADLDLDDTSSYGPETTTIYTPMNGNFLFYVYNYSGDSLTGLSDSGATVMVYKEGATSPSYVFYVPAGEGYAWDVFSYNAATGVITPINEITYYNYYWFDPTSNSWVND